MPIIMRETINFAAHDCVFTSSHFPTAWKNILGRPWCLRHMTKNEISWNEVRKERKKKKREFRTTIGLGVTLHIMYQSLLHGLTEHDNAFAVVFPDHPPHVIHRLRQRSLSRYVGSSQLVALQVSTRK